jgi:hypothetical protein
MSIVLRESKMPVEVTEKSLTPEEKASLTEGDFGIPESRAFPLNDADAVKTAIQMFRHCPKESKVECAKRIVEAASKLGVDVKSKAVLKYCPNVDGE